MGVGPGHGLGRWLRRVGILRESRKPVIVLVRVVAVTGHVAACVRVVVSMSLLQPRGRIGKEIYVASQAVRATSASATVSIGGEIGRDVG